MATQNYALKVYKTVVEDVIANVREAFLDEGVDEAVLQELKQLWESKLSQSRALETLIPEPQQQAMPGNIPYQLMQPQHTHQTQVQSHTPVQQPPPQQQPVPVPLHIGADGQISSAATMAFNAQSGMFQQQLQALVSANPGQQITLQQTASGQYIIHAAAPQGQMMSIPQTAQIVQAPLATSGTQPRGGIPQLDGTHDDVTNDTSDLTSDNTRHPHTNTVHSEPIPCCSHSESKQTIGCDGVDFEIDTSDISAKDLVRLERALNKQCKRKRIPQLDGNHDTSSSEDENSDNDDNDDDDNDEKEEDVGEDVEPLNSEDDVSEEDPTEIFDTDNVVVCQFEKISRNKSKWKFHLKDGIMNLNGKDHVFQRCNGEAEW